MDAGTASAAGYGFAETVEVVVVPPIADVVVDVVPWTELSETPAVVGANPLASGFNKAACALAGSI